MARKKGSAGKKGAATLRTHRLELRLTEKQWWILTHAARSAGVPRSEIVLNALYRSLLSDYISSQWVAGKQTSDIHDAFSKS